MIVLNKPYLTGKEGQYIQQAINHQSSGNGPFTKKCHQFFQEKYGFKKTLLTTSCTDALEMAALLLNITPGDEVIMPSYTFVSTANAFVLRGASIVFADSQNDHPNLDTTSLEKHITSRTKAIVVVHYGGVAVDMDAIMNVAGKYNLFVIEDAAQAIDSYYGAKPLGGIGHLGCFSFHDTKNIVSGEGGLLIVNDDRFISRAEILWEKGTNRSAFIRGEVDKYGWVDVGSSFLPSELTSAFLLAQLEEIENIQSKRRDAWDYYLDKLETIVSPHGVSVPQIPDYARHNAHIFYLTCNSALQRNHLTQSLKAAGIQAFFHYPPLHLSRFYLQSHKPQSIPNASKFFEQLIRIPLYSGIERSQQDFIIGEIASALSQFRLKD
jgi:dTDP-4-amino-4,6-dideoxygalactose transaminase